MSIDKRTAFEAYEYVTNQGLDWEDQRQEVIRQCSYCGAYVMVEDWYGECEHQGETHYNICTDCKEHIEQGKEIDVFNENEEELEDYLAEKEMEEKEDEY